MKTFFGLLLLSGVLAVQEPGINVPCRLLVNDVKGGPRMSSIGEMNPGALHILQVFMAKQNLDFSSVVCVTEKRRAGSIYRVQYNGYNWVEIYSSVYGLLHITGKGVIPPLKEQPF